MKKIVVEKIPPAPQQVNLVTQLTGKELVAYLSGAGTVCLLHRITKDYKDPERFGFFNMAYSDHSSPTFASSSWFDAVKKAAIARELFAFDSYLELISWIVKGNSALAGKDITVKHQAEHKQGAEDPKTLVTKQLLSEISREDVDWNGSDQVNHTHRSMTAMFNKINELVQCLNMAYFRNKSRIFAMAYGAKPENIVFTGEAEGEVKTEAGPRISRNLVLKMLDTTITFGSYSSVVGDTLKLLEQGVIAGKINTIIIRDENENLD